MPVSGDIYYFETRNNKNSSPPIILIHGAGGDHLHWPHNLRRLGTFKVYAPDLPGHGKSGGIGEQSIEKYTTIIHDWMMRLQLWHAVVIGHSMGGAIAQMLAIKYPKCVEALVLISSAASLQVDPGIISLLSSPATFPAAVDQIIKKSYSSHTSSTMIEQVKGKILQTRPGVLLGDYIACNEFNANKNLANIKAPACIICGADDKLTPPNKSQELAERLNNAEYNAISQAGHMVILEKPKDVSAIIEDFLARLESFNLGN
jgi:pimeloyl-ACP methyl ester carboxylesterase